MSTDTVFVWDGIMEFSPGDKPGTRSIKWEGSLFANEHAPVASNVAEPVRDAFQKDCASDLHFSVEGVAESMDGSTDENLFKPFRMNLNKGAGWEYGGKENMDNCATRFSSRACSGKATLTSAKASSMPEALTVRATSSRLVG